MSVKLSQLADQILDRSRAGEFLLNTLTGEEFSANAGDYFMLPSDYIFENCELMTKHEVYERVEL